MTVAHKQPTGRGYSIFCLTVFQGAVPACYEGDYPIAFATELEAQREIADNQIIRLQQFLDGERDFEDAITIDEFVLPVTIWPDSSISTENGRRYGK